MNNFSGIVGYFNDNFEGGEIYYPDNDIIIKPKPGLVVMHESTIRHGVHPVKSGIRYYYTEFLLDDPNLL